MVQAVLKEVTHYVLSCQTRKVSCLVVKIYLNEHSEFNFINGILYPLMGHPGVLIFKLR
jgi:hypothetical protein